MRIPNLNISQSVTQRIRDLDLERLKLDQQISTGQKITNAQDDGAKMSRTIQLDSQKGKLSQYHRNASYASEFLNSGQMNLEKLREINQRAQEIARVAGSNINGSGIESYAYEVDQLIEESLNRINSRHRGRALFGGNELKPDFSHSSVIAQKAETKIFNLKQEFMGLDSPDAKRYLKQGDEIVFQANGREYVVQAKTPNTEEFSLEETYNEGDLVKITQELNDGILVDPSEFNQINDLLVKLDQFDWSKNNVGALQDGSADVYVLDASQIREVAVSLGQQPNLDFFPSSGGHYALVELENGGLMLEPVENKIEGWAPNKKYSSGELVQWGFDVFIAKQDISPSEEFSESSWEKVPAETSSEVFLLTNNSQIKYWEATADNLTSVLPSNSGNSWIQINPHERVSNVSMDKAGLLIRDLINEDAYFINDSKVLEDQDSLSFVRASNQAHGRHDPELELSAKIISSGQLEVTGTVGKTFDASASYLSRYDTRNYYPEQLQGMISERAKSMFPGKSFEMLSSEEKQQVWTTVKDEKLIWDLSVVPGSTDSSSDIELNLSNPWKRLEVYQLGDIVNLDGKLWRSTRNENFNHHPTNPDSDFWEEIGSNYEMNREDWKIESTGIETRFYYSSPDGRLFNDRLDAINHSFEILVNSTKSYEDQNQLSFDAENLVRKVAYPVSRFKAEASDSNGVVYFDASSQSYQLAALNEGQQEVTGSFLKGEISDPTSQGVTRGDVVQTGGGYFLTVNVLAEEEVNSVYGFGLLNEVDEIGEINGSLAVGEKVYEESSGRIYMFLGNSLPTEGRESVLQSGVEQPMRKGSYIYDSQNKTYYVAQENINDANKVNLADLDPMLVPVNAFEAVQGAEWSASDSYLKGQVVFHHGVYYECQTNGSPDNEGRIVGFNNKDDEEQLGTNGDYFFRTVSPLDDFYYEVEDAMSRETFDLRRARGQDISNNVWLPVTNTVNHVLSFDVSNRDLPDVNIQSAGAGGIDAEIDVMTDINGIVTGLRVENPGRYFFPSATDDFGNVAIPDSFQIAEVTMPTGESLRANIIWGENANDPGPFVITGFELLGNATLDKPMGAQRGDSYSFATGKKTFLDHRESDGSLIGVTYTGSDENAEFYVGKDSKISSFLNASNGGTSELVTSLSSLIELREGLLNPNFSERGELTQIAGKELIEQENSLIDKIGELSSVMVRMDTVRAHDEEYFLEIDKRLSSDLDVDLSEAIMQLTRVSTAYQAAMQVGAQLLNTSLLNYL